MIQTDPTEEEYLSAREASAISLQRSIIGNSWQDEEEVELNFNPIFHYVAGILFPQDHSGYHEGSQIELDNGVDLDPELDLQKDQKKISSPDLDDDTEIVNSIDQSTQMKQSAFGINFITSLDEEIRIEYGFSRYSSQNSKSWKQSKHRGTHSLKISNITNTQKLDLYKNLTLTLKTRIKDNQAISTISISHDQVSEPNTKYETADCFFQVGLEIHTLTSHFPPLQSSLQTYATDEAKSLELLFRDKLSYASGNGCATDWEENNLCRKIWTDFLPSYEVKSIEPTSSFDLNTSALANVHNKVGDDEYFELLESMSDSYTAWIQEQAQAITNLDTKYQEAANKHIQSARVWSKRVQAGINILKEDVDARNAFRLTNYGMLIQANRLSVLSVKKSTDSLNFSDKNLNIGEELLINNHDNLEYKWRPFQLAFILGIIPDIVNPQSENSFRDTVDLIWFPTGGGKTEAYLGVLAFSILYRRILDPDDDGVTAIMRYTLRLLTSDQFRRSAALICALEFIRKENILDCGLGDIEISIGLWIGRAASPSTHQDAGYQWSNRDKSGNQTFMLTECPWCKTHLTDHEDSGYKKMRGKVIIKCSDSSCYFHDSIPVYLWQEAIFEMKPSLLLATVDNFAKLAWLPQAIELFSNPSKSPPELIIQDELHLIAGPLGSMVGLYETILLKILERDGVKPKIIGATATLSIEGSQSQALYRGRSSSIFPPQVLSWGDSFFAKENKEKYGRQYIGYFGSAKGSMIESAFSASIPLLQAVNNKLPTLGKTSLKGEKNIEITNKELEINSSFSVFHGSAFTEYKILKISQKEENYILTLDKELAGDLKDGAGIYPNPSSADMARDPYGTLVWYFNSKRELAYISNQENRMRDRLKSDARYQNAGNLGDSKAPSRFARRINHTEELTGRLSQDEIQNIIAEVRKPWTQVMTQFDRKTGIDILYSTNMISVGVDISRLGLMLVHGHTRSTSEYIQATSRVGRQYPGLVVTAYNHGKSKDRSIYENFKNYHQSFYRFVETVSVTPYSSGARAKALPAVFIALARAFGVKQPSVSSNDETALTGAKDWLLSSVDLVDAEEYANTEKEINLIIKKWKNSQPTAWGQMGGMTQDEVKLMGVSGEPENNNIIFQAPTSMRTVAAGINIKFYDEYGDLEDAN